VALELVVRIAERSRQNPPPARTPSHSELVKSRWTDEMIDRLRVEAPKSTDDIELAETLGLPPYCRGAMRAARSRYGLLRGIKMANPIPRPAQRRQGRPSRLRPELAVGA
jgi:hypothetical protein